MKEITSYQATQWDFGNFLVPFGTPKMIVADADGIVSGILRKTSQYTLLTPAHTVTRGNNKLIGS